MNGILQTATEIDRCPRCNSALEIDERPITINDLTCFDMSCLECGRLGLLVYLKDDEEDGYERDDEHFLMQLWYVKGKANPLIWLYYYTFTTAVEILCHHHWHKNGAFRMLYERLHLRLYGEALPKV